MPVRKQNSETQFMAELSTQLITKLIICCVFLCPFSFHLVTLFIFWNLLISLISFFKIIFLFRITPPLSIILHRGKWSYQLATIPPSFFCTSILRYLISLLPGSEERAPWHHLTKLTSTTCLFNLISF